MSVETFYVDSLEDFIKKVRELRKKWDELELWFRGVHSARRHPLVPTLYRPPRKAKEGPSRANEDEARIEFSRRALALVSEKEPESDFDWYVLMRHNDMPTRLLDWTEGSLLALYFAVRSGEGESPRKQRKEDAAVWVLDPAWLNKKVIRKWDLLATSDRKWEGIIRKYLPKPRSKKKKGLLPVAVLPRYLLLQMLVQRSAFTIQGAPDGFERIGSLSGAKRLAKIVIRHSKFHEIEDDLEMCGISEATVFPKLEGLGKALTRSYVE